jgi:IclR family transcriptional regulator, acetate operon repressor
VRELYRSFVQNSDSTGPDRGLPYAVESVVSASRILLMLRANTELQVGQVAEELGVARSTAHRLLTTLESQGLLRQAGARLPYRAGPGLIEIGSQVVGAVDLRERARPLLERLARETGETAHLLVLHGLEVVFVDGVEGTNVIRAATRIGARQSAHVSAAGKALLAELPHAELMQRYPGEDLVGGTAKAIQTRSKLIDELRHSVRRGYAVNRCESEPDLCAVSVVIRDFNDSAIGAVSVSGPSFRMEGHLQECAKVVRRLVGEL